MHAQFCRNLHLLRARVYTEAYKTSGALSSHSNVACEAHCQLACAEDNRIRQALFDREQRSGLLAGTCPYMVQPMGQHIR